MLKILKRDLLKWGLNFISNIFCPYERLLSPRIFLRYAGNELLKPDIGIHMCVYGGKKEKWIMSPAYLCNDPLHCFSLALTDCTWTGPWKAALTTRHPWANQKAVQNNGLLLQSCHLRGRCVEERDGGLFGHDRGGYTTPSGHGRWHWKKGRVLTKAGASESSS